MYLNGMGLRGIERVTEIHHTTVMHWVTDAGLKLPDAPEADEIPEITEIDELQTPTHLECIQGGKRGAFRTFIGNKKAKVWIWTVVNHWKPGIILWTIGDRSHSSFQNLWFAIKCWHSFWYVTDGWKVYPSLIEPEDHLVSKTADPPRMHSRWKAAASPI